MYSIAGKILRSESTLQDYGLAKNATITIYKRMPGGAPITCQLLGSNGNQIANVTIDENTTVMQLKRRVMKDYAVDYPFNLEINGKENNYFSFAKIFSPVFQRFL